MNTSKSNTKKKSIEYIIGSKELLNFVDPLWEKLNSHHLEKSINFKEKFKKFNFKMRKEVIDKKEESTFFIILAKDNDLDKYIGYCMASVSQNNTGEIESIYVEPEYRGLQIGDTFMRKSLEWIKNNGGNKINIGVAAGNENAFNFYAKFGFYPKVTILEQP